MAAHRPTRDRKASTMKQHTDWNKFFANHPKVRRSTKTKKRTPLNGGTSNERSLRLRSLDPSEQVRPAAFTFNLNIIEEAGSLI